MCVPNIDYLRSRILEKAHGSLYYIHPGSTKMYHDLRMGIFVEWYKKRYCGVCCKMHQMSTNEGRALKLEWSSTRNMNSYFYVGRCQHGF